MRSGGREGGEAQRRTRSRSARWSRRAASSRRLRTGASTAAPSLSKSASTRPRAPRSRSRKTTRTTRRRARTSSRSTPSNGRSASPAPACRGPCLCAHQLAHVGGRDRRREAGRPARQDQDHYAVLGLSRLRYKATDEDFKRACTCNLSQCRRAERARLTPQDARWSRPSLVPRRPAQGAQAPPGQECGDARRAHRSGQLLQVHSERSAGDGALRCRVGVLTQGLSSVTRGGWIR